MLPSGQFFMLFLSSADFFKIIFSKNSIQNTIRVKQFGSRSGLTFCSVGPDLVPSVLQSYQQMQKRQRVNE